MPLIDPRTHPIAKVRIRNRPSGRYLSLYGEGQQWNDLDGRVTLYDWRVDPDGPLKNSQIWNIIQFREQSWILLNQYSSLSLTTRGGHTDQGTDVVQYGLEIDPARHWTFEPAFPPGSDPQFHIRFFADPSKCIGFQGTDRHNNTQCVLVDLPSNAMGDDFRWEFDDGGF
jgi:Ricin-type beta-trefoil lectin domain-like